MQHTFSLVQVSEKFMAQLRLFFDVEGNYVYFILFFFKKRRRGWLGVTDGLNYSIVVWMKRALKKTFSESIKVNSLYFLLFFFHISPLPAPNVATILSCLSLTIFLLFIAALPAVRFMWVLKYRDNFQPRLK